MKFALLLGFSHYQDFPALAQAAETAGFSSVSIPDSLFYPQTTESEYPYNDTQTIRNYINATAFIEPFIAMSTMAAVTSRIRFYPGVLKVPVRQPLILAKLLSSLAVVSNERVALGAGLSPWKEDFIYNGVPFERRGVLMDECIAIIRGVMSGEFFEFHSENYDFGPLKMNPVPATPIPILIGGHTTPALKRAAYLGDGWVSANSDFDTLAKLIGELNRYRQEYGTADRTDFEVHVNDAAARTVADFRRLAQLGATEAGWGYASAVRDRQGQIDAIKRFGDEVIAKYS
ncbi:F420-dependent oxidoreductase [Steroidobacter denitrificans]|uniref:F420-dependent oxidoreductase n=1 Tax=Steroidobacter denitrificans TaxID=465721 RepID=A0A127F7L4_STEDE|nr:TIGR03619 family F420-dependent LLM class oxidoreductase [Steroidobacter denitrificans]AMN45588.1 F420-dependent oxidoreductase [Steroidobacter denitrificans]